MVRFDSFWAIKAEGQRESSQKNLAEASSFIASDTLHLNPFKRSNVLSAWLDPLSFVVAQETHSLDRGLSDIIGTKPSSELTTTMIKIQNPNREGKGKTHLKIKLAPKTASADENREKMKT